MRITVNYTNLSNAQEKALADCKAWLGAEKFDHLTSLFKSSYPAITVEQFQVMVDFAGIRGYPARAWYTYIYS